MIKMTKKDIKRDPKGCLKVLMWNRNDPHFKSSVIQYGPFIVNELTPEEARQYVRFTGNSFDIEILIQELDENPGKKTTQAEATKIGENLYYNKYTTQVLDDLDRLGRITLKEGDIVTVTARNTNQTISQMLRNFFYMISGNDSYQIAGQHTGVVAVNGSTSG